MKSFKDGSMASREIADDLEKNEEVKLPSEGQLEEEEVSFGEPWKAAKHSGEKRPE